MLARETIEGAGSSVVPRLLTWMDTHAHGATLIVIGHRIVHGGRTYRDPHRITTALLDDLTPLIPFAPNHLPDEIVLIDVLEQHRSLPTPEKRLLRLFRIDDADAVGRVDVELFADGSAAVTWIEFANQRSEFHIRRGERNGSRSASLAVSES